MKIVFSDEKVPGESKSKIYDFIRSQVSSDNYNEDLTHFIVSSDSDNLLFSVPLFEANIFICQNPSETESIIKISEIHNFIHEKTLKEATDEETLAFIEENSIKERVFYDFVLMFLLIGNDYLPSLPNFENKLRSMYHLMECYKKFLKK